jgi:hypothetical protein
MSWDGKNHDAPKAAERATLGTDPVTRDQLVEIEENIMKMLENLHQKMSTSPAGDARSIESKNLAGEFKKMSWEGKNHDATKTTAKATSGTDPVTREELVEVEEHIMKLMEKIQSGGGNQKP